MAAARQNRPVLPTGELLNFSASNLDNPRNQWLRRQFRDTAKAIWEAKKHQNAAEASVSRKQLDGICPKTSSWMIFRRYPAHILQWGKPPPGNVAVNVPCSACGDSRRAVA